MDARGYRLKRLFNLTTEQYDAMFFAQSNGCAICGKPPKNIRLAVDHDHKTGLVRGLLCMACNKLLAYGKDNAELLTAAAKYLTTPPALGIIGETFGIKGSVVKRRRRRKRNKLITKTTISN